MPPIGACRAQCRVKRKAATEGREAPNLVFGKVGNGDSAVTIEFVFSGLPVPFDPANPSRHLREKTVVAAYIAKATEGNTH